MSFLFWMKNIQWCYMTLSVIRMKYFASEKLKTKLFEFSKIFSSFIILKCKNSSCYLNFCIDWHEIFFLILLACKLCKMKEIWIFWSLFLIVNLQIIRLCHQYWNILNVNVMFELFYRWVFSFWSHHYFHYCCQNLLIQNLTSILILILILLLSKHSKFFLELNKYSCQIDLLKKLDFLNLLF